MKYLILLLLSFSSYASESGALHDKVSEVAPITGVSLGKIDDKSTWKIIFKPEATPEQRAAAAQIVREFDPAVDAVAPKTELQQAKEEIEALKVRLSAVEVKTATK